MARHDITIMALDIATVTGVAVWNMRDHESAIRTYTVRLKGRTHEDKAAEAGPAFRELFREYRPHFVSIEAPRKDVQRHEKKRHGADLLGDQGDPEMSINPASVILPNQLTGAVMGQIGICKLPWTLISEGTWRKCFLGFGRKQGWSRPDYKKAARQKCEMIGINVTNDDTADAVGVLWATSADEVFKSFINDYEKLIQQRNERVAA